MFSEKEKYNKNPAFPGRVDEDFSREDYFILSLTVSLSAGKGVVLVAGAGVF